MDKPNNDNSVKKEETTKLLTKTNTAKYSTNSTKVEMTKKDGNSEKKQKSKKKKTAAQTEIDIEKGTSPSKCDNNWLPVTFKELPDWLKDNDFIHKWYRPPLPSIPVCLRSLFRIHNETGNIWTHLVAAVIIFFGACNYWYANSETTILDKSMVMLGLISAIICFSISAMYHTMCCHSNQVCIFSSKMDYSGITCLMASNYLPWIYFQFRGNPTCKVRYMSMFLLTGFYCLYVFWGDSVNGPKFRFKRWCLFFMLAMSGLVPLVHLHVYVGYHEAHLQWLYWQLLSNFVGGIIYIYRIPERFFPGKCDLLFHSHQIFHVCCVLAWYFVFAGILRAQEAHASTGFEIYQTGINASLHFEDWNL